MTKQTYTTQEGKDIKVNTRSTVAELDQIISELGIQLPSGLTKGMKLQSVLEALDEMSKEIAYEDEKASEEGEYAVLVLPEEEEAQPEVEMETVHDIAEWTGSEVPVILEDMTMKAIKELIASHESDTGEKVVNKNHMTNEELRQEAFDIVADFATDVERPVKAKKAKKAKKATEPKAKKANDEDKAAELLAERPELQGIIKDSSSKSEAIRTLYNMDIEVVSIYHILNMVGFPTRYQMVYQVVENYKDKILDAAAKAEAEKKEAK